MSRASPVSWPVSRPTGIDYLLILVGCSLSLFLQSLSGPNVQPRAEAPAAVREYLLPLLPSMLALPQGIILLWPVFYALQRLRGRPQALSAGEWLWGFAWLGTVLLTGWVVWLHFGTPPGFAEELAYPPQSVWTVIVLPAMALIAVVIGLVNLVARWQQPWTHTLALALVIWPMLPLAGLLLWAEPGWGWGRGWGK
jgi:hypothetical protein